MKVTFEAYPELLMVNAMYKLTKLRMPLYLMLIVIFITQPVIRPMPIMVRFII